MSDVPDPPEETLGDTHSPTLPGAAAPRTLIGPYSLLQKIGEGGMGEVWLAQQERPVRRRVALKLIKTGMDTAAVLARFDAERQALAMMNHPSIARVFDAGSTDQGRPFFAMEYVDGEPITTYCDRHRLTTNERLELFMRVCDGVQHAHQKGILHRDLKPTNVLVRAENDQPEPKIIDFGLAKAFDHRLTERTLYTEIGVVVGTPEYMSPEQSEGSGADVDTRTDVYSLGVLLYVLLVGALPFTTESRKQGMEALRKAIREQDPTKPSTRIRALAQDSAEAAECRRTDPVTLQRLMRGDLDAITMKALEKDRTRRYDSASELAMDIQRHLAHQPVLATPPSPAYLAKKFVRRHRVGVAASALVALVLIAATIVSTGLYFRAESARKEAEFRAYVASLSAAAAALDLNDAGAVKRHLDSTAEALRGWEWHWLRNESDRSLATTLELPPEKTGYCMGLSDDGRLVAARPATGTIAPIRVFDTRDGRQLHEFPTWESFAIRFQFSPDRRLLAYSATSPSSMQIWDLTTGEARLPDDSVEKYEFLDFDEQGVHAALSEATGIQIVRLSDWRVTRRWDLPIGMDDMTVGGFSSEGSRLAVAFEKPDIVRVYNVASGALLHELPGMGGVTACQFTPDGTTLALLGSKLHLVDVETGEIRTSIEKIGTYGPLAGGGNVTFVDVASRTAVAGVGKDGVLRACRLDSSEPRSEIRGEPNRATSIAWDAEVGCLVTSHARGAVRQWPLFPDWSSARGVSAPALAFAKQQGLLCVGKAAQSNQPQAVAFVDLDANRPSGGLQQFPITHAHGGGAADFAESPDGTRMALVTTSGWGQGRLKIFDIATGLTAYNSDPFWGRDPLGVAWSPDGKHVAVVGNQGLARVLDPASETGRPVELWGHKGAVEDLAYEPDGSRVWTAGADGTLRAWDPTSGASLEVQVTPDSVGITCLSLFEKERALVCGLATGELIVWDLAKQEFGDRIAAHSDRVEEIARTPDGTRVVTGAVDGSIVFWEPGSWRELLSRRVEAGVNAVAFSPDGERLAFGRTVIRVLDKRPEEARVASRKTHREAQEAAASWLASLEAEKVTPAETWQRIQSNTAQSQPVKDAAVMAFFERRDAAFTAAAARAPEIADPTVRREVLRDLCVTPANDRYWLDLSAAANDIRARTDLSEVERDVAAEYALGLRFQMHGYEELMGEGVWTNVLIREMLQGPEERPGDWALALFAAEDLAFAVPTSNDFQETLTMAKRRTGWPGAKDSLMALRSSLHVGEPTGSYEMSSLGFRHWKRGNLADAERFLKNAVDRRTTLGSAHDRSRPAGMAAYAEILHATGRDEDAEKWFRDAFALTKEIRGEDHIDTALRGVDLGRFLAETDRVAEAEPLLRDAAERARRLQGNDHPDVAAALVGLAEVLNARGAFEDAEPLAREALTIRQQALEAGDWRVGEAMSVLGEAVSGQKKFAEAEPLLLGGYETMQGETGRYGARRVAASKRLEAHYRAWGKPAEETRWHAVVASL